MKTRYAAAALLCFSSIAQADAVLAYRGATAECRAEFDTLRVSGSRLRIDGSPVATRLSVATPAEAESGLAL